MIIYEIKNKLNGKSYIGQHNSEELGSYWGSGLLIKKAIEKYGIENFDRIILEKCNTKDELNQREKYWIKEKDTINFGYNLTEGGTGGDNSKFIKYSSEWKNGQRVRTLLYWDNLSSEDKIDRSKKVSGENNAMYGKNGYWKGKKLSVETIQKMLESRRSYKGSNNPNWKGGISIKKCKCGKHISPKNKTCINCVNRRGGSNPFYGKKHSNETKKILSEKRMGKKPTNVRQVRIDGVIYESLAEASRQTGISPSTILWRVKSKNKKYDNYKYLTN